MLIYKQWLGLIDLDRQIRLDLNPICVQSDKVISVAVDVLRKNILFIPDHILQVMIYRLITRGTIEERMMQLTKKKMILEHLVVGRLKAQTINQV